MNQFRQSPETARNRAALSTALLLAGLALAVYVLAYVLTV